METTTRQNHFGDLTIIWREPMTDADVSDLESYLNLWLRGVKRRCAAANPVPSTPSE